MNGAPQSQRVTALKPTPLRLERRATFEKFGTLHLPEESEAPILAGPVRTVVAQWLQELQCEAELAAVGLKPRRRCLLVGPPGCGKTTLAHHLAARLGLPLVVLNFGSLVSKYVGQTGEQMSQLAEAATKDAANVVLFFDEIDAVAGRRGAGDTGASREQNNIVIALLQMLDRVGGLMFAATNREDIIDPAVWRRFELHLTIDLPDQDARFAILKRYLAPFVVDDETLDVLTTQTMRASPALLRGIMESTKRDLVLGRRFQRDLTAPAVIGRAVRGMRPPPDLGDVPLWTHTDTELPTLARCPWPPTLPPANGDAA